MKYPEIRNQLGSFLHQDYDLDAGSAPQAILAAIQHSKLAALLAELASLEKEPDEVVREILSDHCVEIFQKITPRDLLKAMSVFATLYLEEEIIKKNEPNK